MPMVYAFKQFDIISGYEKVAARKATREAIKHGEFTLIERTGEEVSPDEIDGDGFYHAKA